MEIYPENLHYYIDDINSRLLRRGLVADSSHGWEKHGPHSPNMNYPVYVGFAVPDDADTKCRYCNLPWRDCKRHDNHYCVAVYPHGVFEIMDTADWYRVGPEERIRVIS